MGDPLQGWTFQLNTRDESPVRLVSVTYGQNLFVAVGDNDLGLTTGAVLTSSEGMFWKRTIVSAVQNFRCITYGNGSFVAVGYDKNFKNVVLTSPDGINWVANTTISSSYLLSAVTYGNNLFVAVGGNGVIYSSTDGEIWISRNSGSTNFLTGVTYGSGIYAAVGGTNILTSPDAIVWTSRQSSTPSALLAIASGNGSFIAVGASGSIQTSTTGMEWQLQNSGITNDLQAVVCGENNHTAVGTDGIILTSSDATVWKVRNQETSNVLLGVAKGVSNFVIVGPSTILRSGEVQLEINGALTSYSPINRILGLPPGFAFAVNNPVGSAFRLESSLDFTNWLFGGQITNVRTTTFIGSTTTNQPYRFYRVISP